MAKGDQILRWDRETQTLTIEVENGDEADDTKYPVDWPVTSVEEDRRRAEQEGSPAPTEAEDS